jgi:acetoin utilization deacetylase AcuC-like enzyme
MKTGYVWEEWFMWHDTGSGAGFLPAGGPIQPGTHAENPEPKRRLHNLLARSGIREKLVDIDARRATVEELTRVHTEEYIEDIEMMSNNGGGDAGDDTPFGQDSYEIARLAAGGVIEATNNVLNGKIDNAYALVRPPGHHAERDQGRGFCLFGNIAVGARHAQVEHSIDRVAVVDFDVHHGNGTQSIFWTDQSVLPISIHQAANYPIESGTIDEVGEGSGRGYNLNIPLPPGSGVGAYETTFERVVIPALKQFDPDLIYIAAGVDSSAIDPLGRMLLHSEGYRRLTNMLVETSDEVCDGKIVAVHEGGYSSAYAPFAGLAIVEELSDVRTDVEDPFLPSFKKLKYQDLQPHQEDVINAAAEQLKIGLK